MEDTPNRNSARPGDISAMPRKSQDSEGSGVSLGRTRQATWISRAEVDSRSVLVAALLEKVRAIDAASFERSC